MPVPLVICTPPGDGGVPFSLIDDVSEGHLIQPHLVDLNRFDDRDRLFHRVDHCLSSPR